MKNILENLAKNPILLLVIALIGIVVPILLDWWNSASYELKLELIEKASLLEKKTDPQKLDKLQILYDGINVDQVTGGIFTLTNTGNKPIGESDVKSPVVLKFSSEIHLLDSKILESTPKDVINGTEVIIEDTTVRLQFGLLNPGDSFKFMVLVSGRSFDYEPSARITNIKQLSSVDQTKEAVESKNNSWIYFIGSVILVIIFIGSFLSLRKDLINYFKLKFEIEADSLPVLENKENCLTYIEENLQRLTPSHREQIRQYVNTLDNPNINFQEFKKKLLEIADFNNILNAMVMFVVAITALIWYIFNSMVFN